MDLVVAAGDASLIVDDEQAVIDALGDELIFSASRLDDPPRADDERRPRWQHGADGEQRVGRIGERERHRGLRPDHDIDAGKIARLGEVEIVGEDLGAVLGAPFVGLIDIGLDDAQADIRTGLRRAGEPAFAPHIAEPKKQHERAGQRDGASASAKPRVAGCENRQRARE